MPTFTKSYATSKNHPSKMFKRGGNARLTIGGTGKARPRSVSQGRAPGIKAAVATKRKTKTARVRQGGGY